MSGSDVEDLRVAADPWAAFPAEVEPRPLVFTGSTIVLEGAGFGSGEAKVAFSDGRIEIASGIPCEAVGSLRAARTTGVRGVGSSIRLYAAELITHAFATDRGPRLLRAWQLLITDTLGPTYVPDEQELASAWSQPGRPAYAFRLETGGHASLGDGLSVAYRFAGIPTAYADYPSVRLLEDPAVVVVAPVAALRGSGSRRRYAETREVTFRLQQPLGNRVLVNPDGQPVTVAEQDPDALLPAGRGDR